jgi:hypothetical protein
MNPQKPKHLTVFIGHFSPVQFKALLRVLPGRTITSLTNKGIKISDLAIEELERLVSADEFYILPKNDLAGLLHNLALREIQRRVKRNHALSKRYSIKYDQLDW